MLEILRLKGQDSIDLQGLSDKAKLSIKKLLNMK